MKYFSILFLIMLAQVAFSQQNPSLNMRLLAQWDDKTIPKESGWVGNTYNEVWGWYNPKDGREYAIIGSTLGTHIIEVTDINHIYQADFVAGKYNNAIHRDFKTLQEKYVVGVCDEGNSTLQIIDMSYLPDSVHVVCDDSTIFERAHNIYIENNRIYAATPSIGVPTTKLWGLMILDATDPKKPILLEKYESEVYGNVHDLHVRNDTMFANAGGRGLYVSDMKDLNNTHLLAVLSGYPYAGYNHSGWLNEKGNTYVMADETHGMPVKVIDVSDRNDPNVLSFVAPNMQLNPTYGKAIPHNPLVKGNTAFVAYYYHGVQVFDISQPKSPTLIGSFDTYPDQDAMFYAGAWGVYPFLPSGHILAGDTEYGLYVLGFQPDSTQQPEINVYPNIATSSTRFVSKRMLQNPLVEIFDTKGRIVYRKSLEQPTNEIYVSVEGWQTGLYLWRITEGSKTFKSGKLMIE